ncbi:unnamed protein product [Adineta steineri]|uniref:Uncharacterized protein n=1 Tax=Adineta steineri TaxID=433720 RepID=A0A814V2Y4_9BILA|nr:unnamed protein product [Adineta steineri]CAF1427536.1 unnamed protein product [Adineta steineri]
MLIAGLILAGIIFLLIHFLRSDDTGDSSIPYAKCASYPIVGHLFSFLRDRRKLFLECSKQYGDCFRIRMFNQYFTMILSHTDWTNVVRNSAFQFSATDFAVQIFDISRVFHGRSDYDADTHRLYIQHLKNREGLRPIVTQFVRQMRELIKNDKTILEKNGNTSEWISSGLLEFSHHMLYQPSTVALIGDTNPLDAEDDFRLFDTKFHYFLIPFPRWMASLLLSREFQARSRLNEFWPKTLDPPGSSQFHRDRLEMFSNHSQWMPDKDKAALQTAFFWASLGNTIPAVFWSLFYILRDPKAISTITEEINTHLPAVPLDGDEDWTPEQLDACVYLESAINETIRLVGTIFMTRKCIRDAQLILQDGRTVQFKEGENLAWFAGASHYSEKFFVKPNEFHFDRFLNKKADSVPGFMPFGGGKSICPGRFFAKFEIKACLAMLLRYMEYQIQDTQTIPTQMKARIGFGIAPPTKDIPIIYRYKS